MTCAVEFNLITDGLLQIALAPVAAVFVTVFAAVWAPWAARSEEHEIISVVGAIGAVLVAVGWLIAAASGIGTYAKYARLLHSGEVARVEGRVERFDGIVPTGKGGGEESFWIHSQRFTYSRYERGPFFHETRADDGPVREGVYLRILHVRSRIVRLETCTSRSAMIEAPVSAR